MPKYIVRSAVPLRLRAEPAPPRRAHDRKDRIEWARASRRKSHEYLISEWLVKHNITSNPEEFQDSVMGTAVVEMEAGQLTEMRSELQQSEVPTEAIEDAPIRLIRPVYTASATGGEPKTIDELEAADLWHLAAIGLVTARYRDCAGRGEGVKVAVLDTGVDASHPEFTGDDGVCRIDSASAVVDSDSGRLRTQGPPQDADGHGTHVAGLICGKTVGVAPGATVASCAMLPDGTGALSNFAEALEWAAGQSEISIVNISAGLFAYEPKLEAWIDELLGLEVLPIAAIGNEGRNRSRCPGNLPTSLSVGSSSRFGLTSAFSGAAVVVANNHVYQVPSVLAPGQDITSSVLGNRYEAWSGTSMSVPIVSGIAALIWEAAPSLGVEDVRDRILRSCRRLREGLLRQGEGEVQVRPNRWS